MQSTNCITKLKMLKRYLMEISLIAIIATFTIVTLNHRKVHDDTVNLNNEHKSLRQRLLIEGPKYRVASNALDALDALTFFKLNGLSCSREKSCVVAGNTIPNKSFQNGMWEFNQNSMGQSNVVFTPEQSSIGMGSVRFKNFNREMPNHVLTSLKFRGMTTSDFYWAGYDILIQDSDRNRESKIILRITSHKKVSRAYDTQRSIPVCTFDYVLNSYQNSEWETFYVDRFTEKLASAESSIPGITCPFTIFEMPPGSPLVMMEIVVGTPVNRRNPFESFKYSEDTKTNKVKDATLYIDNINVRINNIGNINFDLEPVVHEVASSSVPKGFLTKNQWKFENLSLRRNFFFSDKYASIGEGSLKIEELSSTGIRGVGASVSLNEDVQPTDEVMVTLTLDQQLNISSSSLMGVSYDYLIEGDTLDIYQYVLLSIYMKVPWSEPKDSSLSSYSSVSLIRPTTKPAGAVKPLVIGTKILGGKDEPRPRTSKTNQFGYLCRFDYAPNNFSTFPDNAQGWNTVWVDYATIKENNTDFGVACPDSFGEMPEGSSFHSLQIKVGNLSSIREGQAGISVFLDNVYIQLDDGYLNYDFEQTSIVSL